MDPKSAFSSSDSIFSCTSTANASALASPFCTDVPIPTPGVCTDDGIWDSNQRSEEKFKEQSKQCDTEESKKKTCPNDPSQCKFDVFNKTTFCGANDQVCQDPGSSSSCLAYCYADCYPCNDKSDCDLLVSFGVVAQDGDPCFSLEKQDRASLPAVYVRKLIAAARLVAPVNTTS